METPQLKTESIPTSNIDLPKTDYTQYDLSDIQQAQSGVPTHKPKKWKDQFYMRDDGTLWVYINNVWVQVGAGLKVAKGTATSPASEGAVGVSVGFAPKFVKITAFLDSSTVHAFSICSATSTSNDAGFKVYRYNSTNAFMTNGSVTGIIDIASTNDGSSVVYALLSSFDADGFTLDFQNTTNQCTYIWEAFG